MSLSLEALGFSINGIRSHEQMYGLLSEARIKFALATRATALPSPNSEEGVEAGYSIFRSTYDALSHNKWEGHLPSFDDLPSSSPAEAILPYPILHALAFFLDSEQTVCLYSWRFHTGNPDIDRAIVAWPNTILWGLPAKMRFFYDLFEAYGGNPTSEPLLSNSRARAVQLLTVGKLLLERHIKKIGKPETGLLYRP